MNLSVSAFVKMLEEDAVRIMSDYLTRYGEPAIYFPTVEKASTAGFGETTRELSLPDAKLCTVFALQGNQMPFQSYGLTVEEGTLVFSLFPFFVDDRLCLLRRHVMRQGIAIVISLEEALEKYSLPSSITPALPIPFSTNAFLVPSLLPLSGQWGNRKLVGGAFHTLFANLPPAERPAPGSKVQVSYAFSMTLRIKSFACSWRIDDTVEVNDKAVFPYPIGDYLPENSTVGRFVYAYNATLQDE